MDETQIEKEVKAFTKMFIRAIKTYRLPQRKLYGMLKSEFDSEFTRIKLGYITEYDDGSIPPK